MENRDLRCDFEEYVNENLIFFMIMKENYNLKYVFSIVERNIKYVVGCDELILLKFCFFFNICSLYVVFVLCFDILMLFLSVFCKRIFVDWVEYFSYLVWIFLWEVDCSMYFGIGRVIVIIYLVIVNELFDKIVVKEGKSVSEIVVEFIEFFLL